MLSKSQISFIKSLHFKKFRKEHKLFIVEGIKSIEEFIHSEYLVKELFCTQNALANLVKLSRKIKVNAITTAELQKISTLSTPQNILALVEMPADKDMETLQFSDTFTLALDGVQDPGNLGTIIRTAAWFGIKQIICSEDCVEAYNPKVVQATMGSLSRMKIRYTDLTIALEKGNVPVFAAVLNGTPINQTRFGKEGIIVLGNEGTGISDAVLKFIGTKVTIPGAGYTESLNVAVSAAILCYEIKRNT